LAGHDRVYLFIEKEVGSGLFRISESLAAAMISAAFVFGK